MANTTKDVTTLSLMSINEMQSTLDNKSLNNLFTFIITNYPKEYERIISPNVNFNKFPFTYQVFNQADLISNLIFRHFISLVLVDSCFLYHTFNPNSIWCLNLSSIYTLDETKYHAFERFTNVQDIYICGDLDLLRRDPNELFGCHPFEYIRPPIIVSKTFWDGMIMTKFNNVENLMMDFKDNNGLLLKFGKVLSQSTSFVKKLKTFTLHVMCANIYTKLENKIATDSIDIFKQFKDEEIVPSDLLGTFELNLLNCQKICLIRVSFCLVITNKCQELSVKHDCNLNIKSKYFDLSGIKKLDLSYVKF